MSLNRRTDKEIVVHLHNGEWLSCEKKNDIMKFTGKWIIQKKKNHPEWGNPDTGRQISYGIAENWILAIMKIITKL
jgi:hypothetical protein